MVMNSDFEYFQVGREDIPEWFVKDHLIKCTKEINYKDGFSIDFDYTFSPMPFDLEDEDYILYNSRLTERGEWVVRNKDTRFAMVFSSLDFERFFNKN